MAASARAGGARASPAKRRPPANAAATAATTTTATTATATPKDAALCRALIAYGEYHAHPGNQLIHLVCVPALLWSLLVALAYVPLPEALEKALGGAAESPPPPPPPSSLRADLAAGVARAPLPLAALLLYASYYSLALGAPLAGACWTASCGLPLWLGAVRLWRLAPQAAWRWALGAHALSWFAQVVPGHALLERRRPALADAFWQAVATAPLFVFLEVMFAAGWNAPLRARVRDGVEAALRRHRRGGGAGGGGKGGGGGW
jgi:uncharacterized membrane protein YGL010W